MDKDSVFVICGPPRHGKDTFGEFLSKAMGVPTFSTSSVLYEVMAERLDTTVKSLHRLDKEDIREDLVALGNELCDEDPGYLVNRAISEGFQIITGVRRVKEWKATDFPAHLVWIERIGGPLIMDNTEPELRSLAQSVLEFGEGNFMGMQLAAQQLVAGQ